ncbi:MAG: hypothetical protein ACRDX8_13030, partial [Acidimicrobiales bacterium]
MNPAHARSVVITAVAVAGAIGWISVIRGTGKGSTASVWVGTSLVLLLLLGVAEVAPSMAEGLALLMLLGALVSQGQMFVNVLGALTEVTGLARPKTGASTTTPSAASTTTP